MSTSKAKQISASILAGHRAGPDKQNIMPNSMIGGNTSSSSLAQHGSNTLHQMPPHHHHNQIPSNMGNGSGGGGGVHHFSQMQHHKLMNMSNNNVGGGSNDPYQNHYSRIGPFFQYPGSNTNAGQNQHETIIEGGQRQQQHHRSFGLELSNVGGPNSGQPPNKPASSQGTRKGNSTRLHLEGSLQQVHSSHIQGGISGNLFMKSSRNRSRQSLGPSGSASHNTSLNSGVHMFLNRGPGTRKHIHLNSGIGTSGIMSTKNSNINQNASSHNLAQTTRGSTASIHHHNHPINHHAIHRGSNNQSLSQTSNGGGVRAHSANSFHKKQRAGSSSLGSGTVTSNAQQQNNNNSFLPQPPTHSSIMSHNTNPAQQSSNSSSIIPPPPCIGGPRRPSLRKVESLTARPHINLVSTIASSTGQNSSSSRPGSIQRGIATTTTNRASQNCIGSISHRASSAQNNSQQPSYQRILGASGSSNSNSAVKIQRKRLDDFYLNLERDMQNQMLPCDYMDRKNPQLCSQYANQITKYIKDIESRFLPKHGYMRKQTDINQRMRAILIDWLVDVHLKFKLLPQTLYLTVNMIDRFLDKTIISRRKLQLVGISAMLISSKYEQIYPPEIKDFTYITDRAYTKQDVLQMESQILSVLEFNVTVPSSYRFLERFARLYNLQIVNTVNVQQQQNNQGSNTGVRTFMLARYLTQLALIDYNLLKFPPRQVSAAAIYIALRLMKFNPPWNQNLVNASNLTQSQLKPCAKELMSLLDQPDKSNLKAVKKKFSQKKFMEVSKLKLDISSSSSATTSEDRKSNQVLRNTSASGSGHRAFNESENKSDEVGCNSTGGKKSQQ